LHFSALCFNNSVCWSLSRTCMINTIKAIQWTSHVQQICMEQLYICSIHRTSLWFNLYDKQYSEHTLLFKASHTGVELDIGVKVQYIFSSSAHYSTLTRDILILFMQSQASYKGACVGWHQLARCNTCLYLRREDECTTVYSNPGQDTTSFFGGETALGVIDSCRIMTPNTHPNVLSHFLMTTVSVGGRPLQSPPT